MRLCQTAKAAVSEGIRQACRFDPRICDRIDHGRETRADVYRIRALAHRCVGWGTPVTPIDHEIRRRGLGR